MQNGIRIAGVSVWVDQLIFKIQKLVSYNKQFFSEHVLFICYLFHSMGAFRQGHTYGWSAVWITLKKVIFGCF